MGEWIEINALDGSGSFGGYLASPSGAPRAGIVVIQEIFGINAGIREIADGWANEGYLALAPDLFWRLEPRVDLDPNQPEQFNRGIELMGRFDIDKGIADIEAAIKALRARGCAKVGAVGYCLGGKLAYLTAARTDSDATVGYYGVGIAGLLREQHAIGQPLLLHIATEDKFVPKEEQARMHEALGSNRHVTLYDYPADHAFARVGGETRVPELAEQADARTREFFARHLG